MTRRWHGRALLLAGLIAAGCAFDSKGEFERRRALLPTGKSATDGANTPELGSDLPAFSVLTWNLEWFQDMEHGPPDEARQLDGALQVLTRADASLIALQEVSTAQGYAALLAALPEHAGVITRFEWPQQLVLLYRTAQFELISVANIEKLPDAGRAPLDVRLRARPGGAELRVIVVHAKAGGRDSDWLAREGLALGLADHLEEALDRDALIVLGDFNDRLTGSIVAGRPSPYAVFVGDAAYAVPTARLESAGEPSTAWGETIDHIVVAAALAERSAPGAADVLRDELLPMNPRLLEEVSDHLPVTLRLE